MGTFTRVICISALVPEIILYLCPCTSDFHMEVLEVLLSNKMAGPYCNGKDILWLYPTPKMIISHGQLGLQILQGHFTPPPPSPTHPNEDFSWTMRPSDLARIPPPNQEKITFHGQLRHLICIRQWSDHLGSWVPRLSARLNVRLQLLAL